MPSRRLGDSIQSTSTISTFACAFAAEFPDKRVLYEPRAIVHHYVPSERVTWKYFWRRCFYVNREKVEAFSAMGHAANIRAEREFVGRAVTTQVKINLRQVVAGRLVGLTRLGAMTVGLLMAGSGHATGRAQLYLRKLLRRDAAGI